jgi:hypothetical protein
MDEKKISEIILRYYDQNVNTKYSYLKPSEKYPEGKLIVRVRINFTPKKISTISPVSTYSSGEFRYGPNYRSEYEDSFEDMTYVRDEMPILRYISGYYFFDNYCEGIVKDEYLRIKNKYFE